MSIVSAHSLQKSFGNQIVLRAADVTIEPRERIGVVGVNGAGKSTLSRILAGSDAPDSGELSRARGAVVGYLEQVPSFAGDPTAFAAVEGGLVAWSAAVRRHEVASAALGRGTGELGELLAEQEAAAGEVERLGGWQRGHQVSSLLEHLGISRPDARVSELSGGEQRRVALARLLISEPDLAILDEPTNHLDADTVDWLESYLIDEFEHAVLLITHDRYLLDRVAERTLEVENGEVHSYEGGYERYLAQKAERLAHSARTEQNRQNFLRRELEWLRRQPKARTTKQKARIERAEAAKAVVGPKLERTASFELDLVKSGKTILELRELTVRMGERTLVDALSLFLTEGERIGVVGANGSGKTTLLRTILGQHPPSAGTVVLGQNTKVGYFDQGRSGLDDGKSVYENVAGDQSRILLGGEALEPRSYLERFAFDTYKQRQPVGSLSGGERARVALARLLRQSSNLLILDEPTNDLDVATLGALEAMLVELGVTALVVTHDRWFLDRVATSILSFEADGRVVLYPGNYETYRRLRAQADVGRSSAPDVSRPTQSERAAAPKKKGLSAAEQRELAALPDAIEAAEARVRELHETLGNPATYASRTRDVAALSVELGEAKAEVERLTARWEALELRAADVS
ncbi:MAG TPA: ABC-F family ATP-binding cassette domain-containing protein [Polyangiaceae bacterium]